MDPAQLEPRHYQTIAFQEQAKEPTLNLLHRYRNEAARDFDRCLRTLLRLRRERERLEELAEKKRNKLPLPAPQPAIPEPERPPQKAPARQQKQDPQPSRISTATPVEPGPRAVLTLTGPPPVSSSAIENQP
jgi:hypothetical protein